MAFQNGIKTPDSLPVLVGTPGAGAFVLVRSQGKTYRVPVGAMPGASAPDSASLPTAAFAPVSHNHAMSGVTGLVEELAGKEPVIDASTDNNYLRGDKRWANFSGSVRNTVIDGLSVVTNAAISAADSVLSALGKLQAQIAAAQTALNTKANLSGAAFTGPVTSKNGVIITDWNAVLTVGVFMAYQAANAPAGTGWLIGVCTVHNTSWVSQEVWDFVNESETNSQRYRRKCHDGTWGAWYRVYSTAPEIQAVMSAALQAKQAELVSGSNIKTVNGVSLLGSGDVSISSSGVQASVSLAAAVDLNTVTTSGFYRINGGSIANAPGGSYVDWGQLIVSRGGDTIFQIVTGHTDSRFYMRHGAVGTTPVWQPWRELITTDPDSLVRLKRAQMFHIFAASNNTTLVVGRSYGVYVHDGAKNLYLPTPANTAVGDEIELMALHMGWSAINTFTLSPNGNTRINLQNGILNVDRNIGGFKLKCVWHDGTTADWVVMI